MKKTPAIHPLRIDFQVTPEISRFVHIHLILGPRILMIDAGVAGAEEHVCACLASLGRKIEDVDSLLLTHAHPDHIGGAAAIKRLSGCKVYAPSHERDWIEDIERQYRERPIPNFHRLVNEAVQADIWLHGDETIACGNGMTIRVYDTGLRNARSLVGFAQLPVAGRARALYGRCDSRTGRDTDLRERRAVRVFSEEDAGLAGRRPLLFRLVRSSGR